MQEGNGAQPQPGGVQWDLGGMRSHAADVVSAGTTAGQVVVNFGACRPDAASGTLAVELLRRIALRPLTAKHLHDVLDRLIAEEDARANRP